MKLRPVLGVVAVLGLSSGAAFAGDGDGVVKAKPAETAPSAPAKKDENHASENTLDTTAEKTSEKTSENAGELTAEAGDAAPEEKGNRIVSVGIGAQFMGGANFFDKPDDQSINGVNSDPKYPGFAGSSIGGGGFIDVRFIDYIGFEFGVLHMTDKGSAEITITELASGTQSNFDINLKQNALHMPLLLKASVPGVLAQPVFFVGPEFVGPLPACKVDSADRATKPECQAEVVATTPGASLGTKYGIITQNSVNVMFGLGAEFKLPIPNVDIRIPLTFRGAFNPGVSSKRDDREKDTVTGNLLERVDYVTNWKFAVYGNIGTSIHF